MPSGYGTAAGGASEQAGKSAIPISIAHIHDPKRQFGFNMLQKKSSVSKIAKCEGKWQVKSRNACRHCDEQHWTAGMHKPRQLAGVNAPGLQTDAAPWRTDNGPRKLPLVDADCTNKFGEWVSLQRI